MATMGTVAGAAPGRVDRTVGLALLEQMQLLRRFEEKAAEMYALGKIGGFLHLYIGQEAVAVGAMSTLRPDDYAIAGYREHGHILAKGGDPRRIMAELFGRKDGVSKGKGGSMHMFDRAINFLGGHAIVGGYLPIAAGVGFAIRYEDRDRVILCFFGDGSVPQGEFHESMNLAHLWKLPVAFPPAPRLPKRCAPQKVSRPLPAKSPSIPLVTKPLQPTSSWKSSPMTPQSSTTTNS